MPYLMTLVPDSGSGESWFEPRRGNSKGRGAAFLFACHRAPGRRHRLPVGRLIPETDSVSRLPTLLSRARNTRSLRRDWHQSFICLPRFTRPVNPRTQHRIPQLNGKEGGYYGQSATSPPLYRELFIHSYALRRPNDVSLLFARQ